MVTAYVVCNQLGQYLTKKGEWCSGKDANQVFFKTHFDEALNQLFEVNTKDIELRGKVVEVEVEDKKPVIVSYGPDPVQPELDNNASGPTQSDEVVQQTASVA
ncbi:MAG: hypothetical protein MI976_19670 [Pseudomonadales bacterium]|nr:hypothetical protein [Pseudomonadales bacterium]